MTRCAKRRFRTHLDAKIALARSGGKQDRGNQRRAERRAYHCELCHAWHLTSQEER